MDGHARFKELMTEWETRPGIARSIMMGFPCLRADGAFFASCNREGTLLVVKLPAQRVLEAVDAGEAALFAPNGRVFREWAAIPTDRMDTWPEWVAEAHAFVAGKPGD